MAKDDAQRKANKDEYQKFIAEADRKAKAAQAKQKIARDQGKDKGYK